MSQIHGVVDASGPRLLGDSPVRAERRPLELMVLELYRRHAVSPGRAHEICGIDKAAFRRRPVRSESHVAA